MTTLIDMRQIDRRTDRQTDEGQRSA